MKISEVKVTLCNSPPIIAIASITIDNALAINDIRVIKKNNSCYIQFPNHPTTEAHGKHNIVPLTNEVRLQIQNAILQEVSRRKDE